MARAFEAGVRYAGTFLVRNEFGSFASGLLRYLDAGQHGTILFPPTRR